jgi:hypothetical protein
MKRVLKFRSLIRFSHFESLAGDKKFWADLFGNSSTCIEYKQAKAFAKWLREVADWIEENTPV